MIHAQDSKLVNMVPPAALVNNATVTIATTLDTDGFRQARVTVALGALDIALTALKLQESDDNATWSDVPNTDYSVVATLPTATDDNHLFGWDVACLGRKRYLKPVITVGNGATGAYVQVTGELSRASQSPYNAATRGYTNVLTV